MVVDGRLARGRSGFVGHIGQIASNGGKTLENVASGFALGRLAAEFGRKADAREVFEAAKQGQAWALDGLDAAAGAIAAALGTVQRMLDPDVIASSKAERRIECCSDFSFSHLLADLAREEALHGRCVDFIGKS